MSCKKHSTMTKVQPENMPLVVAQASTLAHRPLHRPPMCTASTSPPCRSRHNDVRWTSQYAKSAMFMPHVIVHRTFCILRCTSRFGQSTIPERAFVIPSHFRCTAMSPGDRRSTSHFSKSATSFPKHCTSLRAEYAVGHRTFYRSAISIVKHTVDARLKIRIPYFGRRCSFPGDVGSKLMPFRAMLLHTFVSIPCVKPSFELSNILLVEILVCHCPANNTMVSLLSA